MGHDPAAGDPGRDPQRRRGARPERRCRRDRGRRYGDLVAVAATRLRDVALLEHVDAVIKGGQEPANMVTSRWRYSLMNWGHDPLKG
jgi:hypothetical protein